MEFKEFSLRSLYTGEMLLCLLFGLKMQDPDVGKIHWNLLVLFFLQSYTKVSTTDIKLSYQLLLSLHSIIAVSVYPSLINS